MLSRKLGAVLLCSSIAMIGAGVAPTAAQSSKARDSPLPEKVVSGSVKAGQMDKSKDGDLLVKRNGVEISVPSNASEGTRLTSDRSEIRISLPASSKASKRVIGPEGLPDFDNLDGSVTTTVPKSDGSLQIVTTIESAAAPTEYTYGLTVPAGATLREVDNGNIAIFAADGTTFLGGIAAPWAEAADGKALPTRYVIKDTTLTQVVDHRAEGVAYPVVADPWLGQNLYNSAWVTFKPQGYKVNSNPTNWGASFAGIATWNAHVDEMRTKLGNDSWRMTDSVKEQLYCHLAGVPASLWEFNLESWRPIMNWATQAPYNCNYPEGGWGSWYQ